jgi:hypothetical protein
MVWLPPSQTASRCAKFVSVRAHRAEREATMDKNTMIGVDLAKNIFQLHIATTTGKVLSKKKLSRDRFK